MSGGEPPRVWIDTDIALGAPAGDVDDGFAVAALCAAARAGRIELLGISTVSGNASAGEAEGCARAMAAVSGFAVPVLRGGDARGGGESAGAAIARLPEGTRIVALGPLSNVAAALSAAPDLPGRATLRLVGGNLSSRGFLPPLWPHEFNLAYDRKAARAALSAPWRELALYPLDVVRRLRCDGTRLDAIASCGAPGALLARGSRRWLARTRWRHGRRGFPLWDLPPALEAAGVLPVGIEPRRFPLPQRIFAGIPDRVLAVTSFDAEEAWAAFTGLMSAPSP